MTTVEERLRAAAEEGTAVKFRAHERIEAGLIRRILLSLPRNAGAVAMPAGLRIEGESAAGTAAGPTIVGRIELNDVAIPCDGAIAPIALTNCILKGGFTGARSRFSSLRFTDCRFEDLSAGNVPTIDLGGARLESGLYMAGLSPHGSEDYLWIRAAGLRVAGALDLSRSRLRAPPDHKEERLHCEPSIACLDLTKATIAGDIYALNGVRCDGCVHARGVHVRGNIWLGGATIEAPGSKALMLQRAIIEGSLMLNAPAERADGSGADPAFICVGNLCLRAARIEGDVDLRSAFIGGSADFLDLEVRSDLIFDAAVRDEVDLAGCRIGGSVILSNLVVGTSFERLTIRNGTIGRALERQPAFRDPVLIAARVGVLKSIPGGDLVETLWKERNERDLFQVAFLLVDGTLHLLDGFATGLRQALPRTHDLRKPEKAREFLRLYGIYAHGEAGFPVVSRAEARALTTDPGSKADREVAALPDDFFEIKVVADDDKTIVTACVVHGDRLVQCAFTLSSARGTIEVAKKNLADGPLIDHVPAIHGPFLRHPPAAEADAPRGPILRGEWPMPPAIAGMVERKARELRALQARLLPHVLAAFELHGRIDLGNVNCDMLDDHGGEGWGTRAHFNLNHFVYRHTNWRPDHRGTKSQDIVRNWWAAKRVEWFGLRPADEMPAGPERYWKEWQVRRNWLFQQFYRTSDKEPNPAEDPPEYPARRVFSTRKIKTRLYRPQPFEQVIRVARAEGREDVAAHFEIMKRGLEWRKFNLHVRWPLGFAAIIFAAAWLVRYGETALSAASTLIALLFTIAAMIWGSALRQGGVWLLDRLRSLPERRAANRAVAKFAVWLLYFTPAFILFWAQGWFRTPFYFLLALCIFLAIRLIMVTAHGMFRLCFGYLRRPVQAIVTLILAFLTGWTGVHFANRYEMLVVAVEPVAPLAAAAGAPRRADPPDRWRTVMGSERVGPGEATFAHEISCEPVISEPLYALDVLIPIVDLGEERRCEVRRLVDPLLAAHCRRPDASGDSRCKPPGKLGRLELIENVPRLTVENRRFWWWMKALYAIAGWLIVSLSILTFAQAMRTHAEPSTEHK